MKAILFDLDGVLIEAKMIHYEALNKALGKEYAISWNEHLSTYDGLKTMDKLKLLTINKGLPEYNHKGIFKKKQDYTMEALEAIQPDQKLIELFSSLRDDKYKLACCSNSIKASVTIMLHKLGLTDYFDLVLSNEDIINAKPHPEMYWTAMSIFKVLPQDTVIIEDSPTGLLAAARSGANVVRVNNPNDLTMDKIIPSFVRVTNPKWQGGKLNVLIPMAGAGSRFAQAGYTLPKPLIEVNGKPMIQVVCENLNMDANYIFIVQKSHVEKYNLKTLLRLIQPNCTIIEQDGVTEGAACTTLLASEFINNNAPLIIANSDQFIEWDSNLFMYKMIEQNLDGGIVSFEATHPKWSYAKLNENGYVMEVAEKNPISSIATVGIYYWKHGSDYVRYAEQMIARQIKTNNEFYVCPVFNEAIQDNKLIRTFDVLKMWGLGTPEDLTTFLNNHDTN